MNEQKAARALRRVARDNGVSVGEVRREIEMALAEGRKNPDPKVQALWAAIPCKGSTPSVEEVIVYIAKQTKH